MLIVEDNGVIITLNGQVKDPLFWWSMILLLLGVLVAIICLIAPVFMQSVRWLYLQLWYLCLIFKGKSQNLSYVFTRSLEDYAQTL